MAHFRTGSDRAQTAEQEVELVKAELEQYREANRVLQHQYNLLKTQNDRLLKKEAEHQSARTTLIQKRILISRAVILVPESLIIGDRLENCTLKIFRGNNVTVTDTAELINCRIIGLRNTYDGKTARNAGQVEIRGVFYNSDPRKYAISTRGRVIISPGARLVGNIRAERIVVKELTKVKGRLATRELLRDRRLRKESRQYSKSNELEQSVETEWSGSAESLQISHQR
jgi:hypothetical protein